jgi:hypothetical protein
MYTCLEGTLKTPANRTDIESQEKDPTHARQKVDRFAELGSARREGVAEIENLLVTSYIWKLSFLNGARSPSCDFAA